ncbi:hypothetical protein [uncultured Friedmanniella sp.]|uniref:hypothetical protein n=1 Tax=uncultured Friedmanniella sp. TaxID=335381 RepID=UPI0035CB5E1C
MPTPAKLCLHPDRLLPADPVLRRHLVSETARMVCDDGPTTFHDLLATHPRRAFRL